MIVLLLGLVLFLGVHSIRIVAENWRGTRRAAWGEQRWKGVYSLASLAGFALIVWGFGLARVEPIEVWAPPPALRWATIVLTLPALVLLFAAYVPHNAFKARLGHPMYAGVAVWALGHLLANGRLADILLFGTFLVWSVLGFRAGRQRDRAAGVVYPAANWIGTTSALAVGFIVWGLFGSVLHLVLIGVRPMG